MNDVRSELRNQITDAYNKAFDELETVAAGQNVPFSVLSDKNSVILTNTTSDNIAILKNNVSTEQFYKIEVAKIFNYVKPNTQPVKPDHHNEPENETPSQPKVRQVSLKTKTKLPLKSKDDIEVYLDGLREQLNKLLENCDSVMIIK